MTPNMLLIKVHIIALLSFAFVVPVKAQYIGCYRDSWNRDLNHFLTRSHDLSLESCVLGCRALGFSYTGLQNGDECWCGNQYGSHGQSQECSRTCLDNECGGPWANSVYENDGIEIATPEGWLGCWKDNEDRDFDFLLERSGSMTTARCISGCKNTGYLYAALQHGEECFCGNEYGSLGPSASCNMPCKGDGGDTCGGPWANSVWESGGDGSVRFSRAETADSCIATGWGDPHIITFDGMKYDVHVLGEVTLLKSLNTDFEIQARFESVPMGGNPAVTTGVVVKEADGALPTIQVSLAKESSPYATHVMDHCYVQLYVDGVPVDIRQGSGNSSADVGLFGRLIKIAYPTTNLFLDMEVVVWSNTCHFSIDYILMDCRPDDDLIGILGSPDGNEGNDWMLPNGTLVDIPDGVSSFFFEPAYEYSRNWCIQSSEDSYFAYEAGTDFDYFDHCENAYDSSLERIVEAALDETDNEIVALCNGDLGCIIDGKTLGTEAANAYLEEPAVVYSPTRNPTLSPSSVPSTTPSFRPTISPTVSPTSAPSVSRSSTPTVTQSVSPTQNPTDSPTKTLLTKPITIPSGSMGDPHFRTWKNEHFEYHGQCDLVLARDENFAGGLGLDVQIRTKLVRFWSYIKSAAVRIGNDVLEVQGSGDPEDHKLYYWINFEFQGDLEAIGGFPISTKGTNSKHIFIIDLDSMYPGQQIVLSTFKEFVKVDFVNGTEEAFGNAVGLLGDFRTGDTLARDGATVLQDFVALGNEWQVLPFEPMLFHDTADPQFPKRCLEPEDPRGSRHRRLDEQSISMDEAQKACSVLKDPLEVKDCVYDILATQDMDMVGAF